MGVKAARCWSICSFSVRTVSRIQQAMADGRKSLLAVIPPPLLFLAVFLVGIGAERLFPWRPVWMHSIGGLGWVLLVIGVLLGPANAILFLVERTTVIHTARPTRLITFGAYRLSRNPMYLGISLIYAGVAIILGSLWSLVLLPIPVLVMNAIVIPMEEANAREAFGEQYLAYCRRTRRWL